MKRSILVLTLAIGALSAHEAIAQSNIRLGAVGVSAAFVSPENLDGALGLGVFADLGHITPQIGLEPDLEYWSGSQQSFDAKATVRDISLGARGKYYFDVSNPKIHPFAGAGLGLHFLHATASVTMPGFPTVTSESSDTKLGVDVGGGMAMNVGPRDDLRFDLWYGIVSDVSQLALRVGLSHRVGL